MIRAALILVALGGQVAAETIAILGGDTISLDLVSDSEVTITYHNAVEKRSKPRIFTMNEGKFPIEVQINISGGPETIIVTPPPGFVAMPPEADVIDGESVTVRVLPAMF